VNVPPKTGNAKRARDAWRTLQLSLSASWGRPLAHEVDPRHLLSLPLASTQNDLLDTRGIHQARQGQGHWLARGAPGRTASPTGACPSAAHRAAAVEGVAARAGRGERYARIRPVPFADRPRDRCRYRRPLGQPLAGPVPAPGMAACRCRPITGSTDTHRFSTAPTSCWHSSPPNS
jgi:hypothetical protein